MEPMKTKQRLFTRRTDLTDSDRLYIAYMALTYKGDVWGIVSDLARRFSISRTFVYMLGTLLESHLPIVFGEKNSQVSENKAEISYRHILSLRMEGRCSIQGISTYMKRFDIKNNSTGFISQILDRIGGQLSGTAANASSEPQTLVFASDEIFSKSTPILVTVDPVSSMILKIELSGTRTAKDWSRHWMCLEDHGYKATYLVTDGGSGMSSAQKEVLSDIVKQPDTYHAIAHRIGKFCNTLERRAYSAIEKEYERQRVITSAKSPEVIKKREKSYHEAKKKALEEIEVYDSFCFLYHDLLHELNIFDDYGNLRNQEEARENMAAALELLTTIGVRKISDEVKKIERILPELLSYFEVAKPIVSKLNSTISSQEALQALCLTWQWRKNKIKAKKSARRSYCEAKELFYLELAEAYLPANSSRVREAVFEELDQIVQSSSLVECINSIIRPYLNTSKNRITQQTLNLIMFYHNHRRYMDGKRKDKKPIEILTGTKQEIDWIDLLFDVVKKKDPAFFSSL